MQMELTDIKLRKYFPEGQLEAVYSLTFDNELALHDVKLVKRDGELMMVMPSRVMPDGSRKDIAHPINVEFRKKISEMLLKYHNTVTKCGSTESL